MTADAAGNDVTVDPLAQCRRDIDRIDAVLVALLGERTRLALDAGRITRGSGRDVAAATPEAVVIDRVRDLARGPLPADAAARIFAQIIRETRSVEERHGETRA